MEDPYSLHIVSGAAGKEKKPLEHPGRAFKIVPSLFGQTLLYDNGLKDGERGKMKAEQLRKRQYQVSPCFGAGREGYDHRSMRGGRCRAPALGQSGQVAGVQPPGHRPGERQVWAQCGWGAVAKPNESPVNMC